MAIAKESFGTMPDGTEVYRYTLINKNKVSASFITLGGVWVSMVVPDKDGIPGMWYWDMMIWTATGRTRPISARR